MKKTINLLTLSKTIRNDKERARSGERGLFYAKVRRSAIQGV